MRDVFKHLGILGLGITYVILRCIETLTVCTYVCVMYAGNSSLTNASNAFEDFNSKSVLNVSFVVVFVKSRPFMGSSASAIALLYLMAFYLLACIWLWIPPIIWGLVFTTCLESLHRVQIIYEKWYRRWSICA